MRVRERHALLCDPAATSATHQFFRRFAGHQPPSRGRRELGKIPGAREHAPGAVRVEPLGPRREIIKDDATVLRRSVGGNCRESSCFLASTGVDNFYFQRYRNKKQPLSGIRQWWYFPVMLESKQGGELIQEFLLHIPCSCTSSESEKKFDNYFDQEQFPAKIFTWVPWPGISTASALPPFLRS